MMHLMNTTKTSELVNLSKFIIVIWNHFKIKTVDDDHQNQPEHS